MTEKKKTVTIVKRSKNGPPKVVTFEAKAEPTTAATPAKAKRPAARPSGIAGSVFALIAIATAGALAAVLIRGRARSSAVTPTAPEIPTPAAPAAWRID